MFGNNEPTEHQNRDGPFGTPRKHIGQRPGERMLNARDTGCTPPFRVPTRIPYHPSIIGSIATFANILIASAPRASSAGETACAVFLRTSASAQSGIGFRTRPPGTQQPRASPPVPRSTEPVAHRRRAPLSRDFYVAGA